MQAQPSAPALLSGLSQSQVKASSPANHYSHKRKGESSTLLTFNKRICSESEASHVSYEGEDSPRDRALDSACNSLLRSSTCTSGGIVSETSGSTCTGIMIIPASSGCHLSTQVTAQSKKIQDTVSAERLTLVDSSNSVAALEPGGGTSLLS
eukprot:gene30938-35994_t